MIKQNILSNEARLLQREASDPSVSAWVSASAGSGKTKVLIDRILRLLLSGESPEAILCLTYTKAAAGCNGTHASRNLTDWVVTIGLYLESRHAVHLILSRVFILKFILSSQKTYGEMFK